MSVANRGRRRIIAGLAAVATVTSGAAIAATSMPASAGSQANVSFSTASDKVTVQKDSNGRTSVVRPKDGVAPRPKALPKTAAPAAIAKAHLTKYASEFGVQAKDLKATQTTKLDGGDAVRFDQVVDGVPVVGGQIITSLDANGGMQFAVGETSKQTTGSFPLASRVELATIAKRAISVRTHKSGLLATSKGKQWYDPTLIGGKGTGLRPVYAFEVSDLSKSFSYSVLVNASTKQVELAYDLHQEALNRRICDAKGKVVGNKYKCDYDLAPVRKEGGAASSVADVNQVYNYLGDTAKRYASYVNVDLTKLIGYDWEDGKGKVLEATVRVCQVADECPMENAFWDGQQMIFGAGVTADDITAHELTHGVTQYTAGLYYVYQSGAINEGLSDFWGEMVDQGNGSKDDTTSNKWKIGEGSKLGVIRDMKTPTTYDQPDKVTSDLWWDDPEFLDNGAVHYNSGVFNKAGYLLTDGGSFNGYTIKGLGRAKASKIVWSLQNLLTSGADYKDVYNTLPLACEKNIGDAGSFITKADCAEVAKVVKATELYKEPVRGAAKNIAYCSSGKSQKTTWAEYFDKQSSNWTYEGNTTASGWFQGAATGNQYAAQGKDSAFGSVDAGQTKKLTQKTGFKVPANGMLRFDHAYFLGSDGGAVANYSVDNGKTWKNLSSLPQANGKGWVGYSNGYGASRYVLSSLAGKTVKLQFSLAGKSSGSAWFVDNVRAYTCS